MVNYTYLLQLPPEILLFYRTQWELKKSRECFWSLGSKLQRGEGGGKSKADTPVIVAWDSRCSSYKEREQTD